jgi:hypothetical protein
MHGPSTSRTVRRPWRWAITPQTRQPSCRGGDSTTTGKMDSTTWPLGR